MLILGAYGSPDIGNLYTEEKPIKKKRKLKFNMQVAVLIILYLIMLWAAKDKYYMTISYVGVMSIVYFLVYFIKMIIKLFKKESVNSEVIQLLIATVLIIICLVNYVDRHNRYRPTTLFSNRPKYG